MRRTDSRTIGGRPIQLPTVDVHTVGAGGGSIGWRDPGGALRVGPRSAGAQPGPACYGRGGTEPTVTDANLLLGNLAADSTLAGGVALDAEAAERAVGALAAELGLDPLETAAGIVRVANQEMVRALRVVTVERGVDPRRFALLPFGGAGPMHAAAIAEELGIERLICPRAGGVLSAFGLCASDRRRDTARTVMLSGHDLTSRPHRHRRHRAPRVRRSEPRRRPPRGRLRHALRRPSLRARRPRPCRPRSRRPDRPLRRDPRVPLRPPRPRERSGPGRHPPRPGAGRAGEGSGDDPHSRTAWRFVRAIPNSLSNRAPRTPAPSTSMVSGWTPPSSEEPPNPAPPPKAPSSSSSPRQPWSCHPPGAQESTSSARSTPPARREARGTLDEPPCS